MATWLVKQVGVEVDDWVGGAAGARVDRWVGSWVFGRVRGWVYSNILTKSDSCRIESTLPIFFFNTEGVSFVRESVSLRNLGDSTPTEHEHGVQMNALRDNLTLFAV